MKETKTITELHKWCLDNNRSIMVKSGKLYGYQYEGDEV